MARKNQWLGVLAGMAIAIAMIGLFMWAAEDTKAQVAEGYVQASWDANDPSENVTYYRIRWGTESGVYGGNFQDVIVANLPDPATTRISVPILTAFTIGTYYFVVEARDANNNGSAYSNEVSFLIFATPPPIGQVLGCSVAEHETTLTDAGLTLTIN